MPENATCCRMRGMTRRGLILTAAMVVAIAMGPGVGLYLVNPDLDDPEPAVAALGAPVLLLWALGWLAVQLTIVVIAYRTVWTDEESDG